MESNAGHHESRSKPKQYDLEDGIPIIGLAGAIGAGKSALAGALAQRGCLVIDSDREARAKLDDPVVSRDLVAWWGPGILDEQGKVIRRAVADRIFNDDAARRRLEGLIHPLIRRTRASAQAEGAQAHAIAVVYDAPLLFEAGIDAICDLTVFVDAPRLVRLARVRASRGWDEAELDRREAMQWPIERKKAACDLVISNGGRLEALADAAQRVLAALG